MSAMRISWSASVLVGCVCEAVFAQASFQSVGPLPGGDPSYAYAVSGDGSVVVGSMYIADHYEAFRWTATTGIESLGFMEGGRVSGARGVSADGSMIIGYSNTAATPQSNASFRWTATQGMVDIGDLPGGLGHINATGVSADGSVIVGGAAAPTGGAFRWTQQTGMVNLGNLPGGTGSTAMAVSGDGSVVVGMGNSADLPITEAFRWTQSGGMVGLGTIPGGPNISFARAVSADGNVVVGGIGNHDAAFRWTETDGMVSLGHLSGSDMGADAYGASGDGSIIVGIGNANALPEAFIWDQAHGMRSLRSVLIDDCHLDLGGWALRAATAITPDGLTIVGWGSNGSGPTEAFIAHIPEPTTFSLLIVGCTVLVRHRRHRYGPTMCH